MDDIDILTRSDGLLRCFLLNSESPEEFKELYAALLNEHNPIGVLERQLVTDIAVSLWRLRQIRSWEPAADTEGTALHSFLRYRSEIVDQLRRALALLKALQKDRFKAGGKKAAGAPAPKVIPFPRANVKVARQPAGVRMRFGRTGPQDSSA